MLRAFVLAMFAAAAAPAAAQQAATPVLNLTTEASECTAAEGEVVVCGERGDRETYRIDPDVLQVMRQAEKAANPERQQSRIAEGDPCRIGPNGCPGEGALPLMQMAVTAVTVAVKAAQGEDWREPLRTGPDEYRLYRESKEKREQAKPSVSIGVGIRN